MFYLTLADLAQKEPLPGYKVRFVHTDHVTLAYWEIEAGAKLPEHAHPHEQVGTMLEGTYEFTIGGETKQVNPGEVAVIPTNVPHSGKAVTDCRVLDVFHPVREDYR